MTENENNVNWGAFRFVLSAYVAAIVKLVFNNWKATGNIAVPGDHEKVVSALITATIIAFLWFFIRAIQHNSMDFLMIAGAVVIMFFGAPPLVQWISSAISGQFDLAVSLTEASQQNLITLIGVAGAKILSSPKRFMELLKAIPTFSFDE